MTDRDVLVLGASGLLGSAVVRSHPARTWLATDVRWADPGADRRIRRIVSSFVADRTDCAVAWCAGVSIIGAGTAHLDAETALVRALLESLGDRKDVTVFLASSAGGVHGSRSEGDITESTPPTPISDYGRGKLDQERAVASWAAATGARAVVGRIATLYGPGQSTNKSQGIISALCGSAITHEPVPIYVPLDTIRDFTFVDDAATRIHGSIDLAASAPEGSTTTKLIASFRSASIGTVIATAARVCHRPPLVVHGSSPNRRMHGDALTFRSTVWPELDRVSTMPLPAGIHATWRAMLGHRIGGRTADQRR